MHRQRRPRLSLMTEQTVLTHSRLVAKTIVVRSQVASIRSKAVPRVEIARRGES